MRKLYITALVALGLAMSANAQNVSFKDAGDAQSFEYESLSEDRAGELNNGGARGNTTCATELEWARFRSFDGTNFSYFARILENDTNGYLQGWSTYFDVPAGGSVDVDGFTFFARSARTDSADVDVTCSIFNVDIDGSPTGAAIATVTVPVGEYTGATVAGFEQTANFATTATLTNDFAIVVVPEATTTGDSIDVLSGFTGSGLNDFPTAYLLDLGNGPQWINGSLFTNNVGARILHVYPFIEYNASNSITSSTDTLCSENEAVTFDGDEPIWISNQYWSVEGYTGSSSTFWSTGGAFGVDPTPDTTHIFADPTTNYTVTRHDSLTMLSDFSVCLVTESTTIIGGASSVDLATISLASGTDSDDACANGPGNTTIYNETGVDVFYTSQYIECTPNYVAAGFYSNGTDWWEIGANGALLNTGVCAGDTTDLGGGIIVVGGDTLENINGNYFPLSIQEVASADAQLFPNPANSTLTLRVNGFSGDETYSIIDLHGKVVVINARLGITQGTTDIDVSGFENGIYTIVITGQNANLKKRFTVVR